MQTFSPRVPQNESGQEGGAFVGAGVSSGGKGVEGASVVGVKVISDAVG